MNEGQPALFALRERARLPAPVSSPAVARECQLWFARADALELPLSLLSSAERERHGRYLRPLDARRFLIGSALARSFLARQTGLDAAAVPIERTCPRCGEPHGKPALIGSSWRYSISHAGDYVAVAFCDGSEVGLDVESEARAHSPSVWASVLTSRELAMLHSLPQYRQPAAFLRFWTRKEAVLKCRGTGLTVDPSLLEVSGPDEEPALLGGPSEVGAAAGYHLYDLAALPRHVASLAVAGGPASIRVIELEPAASA